MDSSHNLASTCRCCQYYTPEGRRGGQCSQLHVSVKGSWSGCQLAIPTFAMAWEVDQMLEMQASPSTLKEIISAEYHHLESLDSTPTQPTLATAQLSA